MSGVAVTKALPVIVRPSSESELGTTPPLPNDTTVALSFFDRCVPPIPVTSLLVFDRAIHDPVQTIKLALSRALAHYRPLAGRLDGAGNIACTDEGVPFVAASAGCALQDATPAALRQAEDLVVRYPGLLCCDAADPLLLVQVTEFACGGFAVAVTSNHVAADGVGMGQFLQAVGELARGVVSAPSVVPTRRWDGGGGALPAAPPPKSAAGAERDARRLVRLDVVVPSGLIGRVKAGGFGGERCTALDAVMAVLWRCRTRATTTAGDAPARLNFVCNVRARAGAPPGYYGNCLHMQAVEATAGEVAGSEIGHLVRLIRLAKAKVPGGGDDEDSGVVAGADEQQQQQPLWYEAFNVTDWRNLGLDAVDFGGGPPARVLWQEERTTVPGCVVCPPRRKGAAGREDDDGVDVSTMFVVPEHVDAFLGELAALATAAAE